MLRNKFVFGLVVAAFFGMTQATVWAAYTDKSVHDPGDHKYKHPNQRSFTGPFDYAPSEEPAAMPVREPQVEAGKCNQFTFDATKSYDVDKQKLGVMWDFGDGTTSDQAVVKHVYEKAGDYNVTLTVKDPSGMTCDTGSSSTKVSANFPPTAVAGDDKEACLGNVITFDGSASTSSGAAKYTWNFGDGETAEGAKVTHAYQKAGNYRVTLTVDDEKNTECSVASTAITAAVADRVDVSLKGTEATCTGRAASFDATATGGNLKYHWDFGDGSTWDGGSKASHAYQKGGSYTVTVTADNGQNMACSVATGRTTVKINGTPMADAGENVACCVGKSTAFDGTKSTDPDGDTLTYRWDFGDGSSSDVAQTTHVYEKSGNYRVVLTVQDSSASDCGASSDSFVANVNTQPEAVIQVR